MRAPTALHPTWVLGLRTALPRQPPHHPSPGGVTRGPPQLRARPSASAHSPTTLSKRGGGDGDGGEGARRQCGGGLAGRGRGRRHLSRACRQLDTREKVGSLVGKVGSLIVPRGDLPWT